MSFIFWSFEVFWCNWLCVVYWWMLFKDCRTSRKFFLLYSLLKVSIKIAICPFLSNFWMKTSLFWLIRLTQSSWCYWCLKSIKFWALLKCIIDSNYYYKHYNTWLCNFADWTSAKLKDSRNEVEYITTFTSWSLWYVYSQQAMKIFILNSFFTSFW